ncbi:hypothetical protein M406DRAFT_344188 [Cryphonectria parasitica EP155]|uniref:Amidohydrolase-related domain-containing protein n=1 Tax=Cryphonectria parasitica (strain ATCC 38755 / EP155) TaxID=660469 RepID=A0A9P5CTL2_CRYP1|nr:uncharacterized protein M406DRAFT_344188 [Cryphonectria parasitica EP155]KAF3770463.1 hypothetical protein M406DRAFT_344188 [Cryphonectria parasitica EP155]
MGSVSSEKLLEKKFEAGLASCAALATFPARVEPRDRRENPRWNDVSGQAKTVVLRNATLFDGEAFLEGSVDIVFSRGLITSVSPAGAVVTVNNDDDDNDGIKEVDLRGAYVTPGLVDMHAHHLVLAWPTIEATDDSNEVHPDFGPLTPFVSAIDGMKAYDAATRLIASGGVTSSLIIPGSANIMGGEGAVVKNAVKAGPNGEYVIEEMLLDHGIETGERHRYMKMACGENPKRVYGHTRMGNVWVLRKWLARAKDLIDKQDAWCEGAHMAAAAARSSTEAKARMLADKGGFPEELELESTAAMLRGRVAMHNHCYEPEDMETMLRVSHEFEFRVRAFHHAIEAWQVPEMLKEYGENITVATFAEFALYKQEAYAASLYAGKILNDHGVPVAYKSDNAQEDLSAQYLRFQAAVGHSFGLPADKALQSITSIPARAIDLDFRVGYTRAGYDADIVVWDSHPLSVAATPKQVYIDGVAALDPVKVEENTARVVFETADGVNRGAGKPEMRATIDEEERLQVCTDVRKPGQTLVISGITKSFLDERSGVLPTSESESLGSNLMLIVKDGQVVCLGSSEVGDCANTGIQLSNDNDHVVHIRLKNAHLTRGLTAVTSSLGIVEITTDPDTGDGLANVVKPKEARDAENIDYAKYAVSLAGGEVKAKAFARARLGGVTRAVQSPVTQGGLIAGVSTGLRTGLHSTLLNGGLFQEDVAMHVVLGQDAKANDGAVSMAIERLRALVRAGGSAKKVRDTDATNPWVLVANGSLPLVISAVSNHDIQQTILFKKDYPHVNVVILGGHEAPLFAREIAEAKVPLILTATRPGPDSWTKINSLPGPPLSRSPADVLSEAGVFFGISILGQGGPPGDSRIQSTALEASWAAKYAGLSEREALALVSTNIEQILGLEASGDIVVWEGNPLQFGTPVLGFQAQGGRLEVSSCWPNEVDE